VLVEFRVEGLELKKEKSPADHAD